MARKAITEEGRRKRQIFAFLRVKLLGGNDVRKSESWERRLAKGVIEQAISDWVMGKPQEKAAAGFFIKYESNFEWWAEVADIDTEYVHRILRLAGCPVENINPVRGAESWRSETSSALRS